MQKRWPLKLKAPIVARDETFWPRILYFVLLGLHTVVRGEFAPSPTELLYGENLRLLGDLVFDKRGGLGETRLLGLLQEATSILKSAQSSLHTQPAVHTTKEPTFWLRLMSSEGHCSHHTSAPIGSLSSGSTHSVWTSVVSSR